MTSMPTERAPVTSNTRPRSPAPSGRCLMPARSASGSSATTTTNIATRASGCTPPASVHYGTADQVRDQRRKALHAAYATNPARFGHRRPEPPRLPAAAWINQPSKEALIQSA
jgi:hypothetical protein